MEINDPVIAVVWVHFIADFVVQTRWMADNKSKNLYALLLHIFTYTLCLCVIDVTWALWNGVIHGIQDMVGSNGTSWAFKNKKHKLFWCIIGADQALHLTVLLLTLGRFQ